MLLAQGERRDFLVIDGAGGMHALGKRILGISAAGIRARFADLAPEDLPTVEQARSILFRTQMKMAVGRESTPMPSSPTGADNLDEERDLDSPVAAIAVLPQVWMKDQGESGLTEAGPSDDAIGVGSDGTTGSSDVGDSA